MEILLSCRILFLERLREKKENHKKENFHSGELKPKVQKQTQDCMVRTETARVLEMRLLCTPRRRAVSCCLLVTQQLTSSSSEAVTNGLRALARFHATLRPSSTFAPRHAVHARRKHWESRGPTICCRRGPEAGWYLQARHRARACCGTVAQLPNALV